MRGIIVLFLIGLTIFFTSCKSCGHKKTTSPIPKPDAREVKEIKKTTSIKIKRYEEALFSMSLDDFSAQVAELQRNYPPPFLENKPIAPEKITQLKSFINDKQNKAIYKEIEKKYPDLSDIEADFTDAFSLLKYYFPEAKIPHVYTCISGFYYEKPIYYVDTTLIISLDIYLGKDYKPYKQLGIPAFIIRRFSKEYILRDCFQEMSYSYMKFNNMSSSLLESMIMEGKRWLFSEMMLPNTHDSIITAYSLEQLEWAYTNEQHVWTFLIDKNYLYSSDNMLVRKLVFDAPFTSYFGNDSPGQMGTFIGWQICRSWIKNNPNLSVSALLQETDAQKILKESKYKPQKK